MTTIRVIRRQRFTTIDRETVNDGRLSFRARGILVWLLDKPDDWRCNADDIAAQTTEGRDAVRSALRELQALDYIVRRREQNELGHWVTVTDVFETPQTERLDADDGIPVVGEPGVGSPDVGAPGAIPKTETEDCERRETSSLAVQGEQALRIGSREHRSLLYEALIGGCGYDAEEMTKAMARSAAIAVNQLVEIGVADPEEVSRRCMAYRFKMPNATITPTAVVKHWPGLRPELVEVEQQHRSRMATPQKESASQRVERIRGERSGR